MQEITLNNKRYLLVEVPNEDVNTSSYYDKLYTKYVNNSQGSISFNAYTDIIGKTSSIIKDENICKKLVKEGSYMRTYFNYITNDTHKSNQLHTAIDSFKSYLKSIKLDLTKNYLLIQRFES